MQTASFGYLDRASKAFVRSLVHPFSVCIGYGHSHYRHLLFTAAAETSSSAWL